MRPYVDVSTKWFSVEDVSDLWPTVKPAFEARLPFKRATLNNKTRNPVFVDTLPAEFILTTDSRLRSRFPQEQFLFWFREPYATVVLVTCEVMWFLVDYNSQNLPESCNVLRGRPTIFLPQFVAFCYIVIHLLHMDVFYIT